MIPNLMSSLPFSEAFPTEKTVTNSGEPELQQETA